MDVRLMQTLGSSTGAAAGRAPVAYGEKWSLASGLVPREFPARQNPEGQAAALFPF